jgi:hypothetical protein
LALLLLVGCETSSRSSSPSQVDASDWDDLDDAERGDLHAALREGFEDAKAGRTIDAEQWAAELRSRL